MTVLAAFVAAVIIPAIPATVSAQTTVRQRLQGRVPAQVQRVVERLARDATRKGLPVDPLVQKALEGGAKGVPAARVVAAVQALAGRLETSARAIRAAGSPEPSAAAIEAGAFALSTGIEEGGVARIVRASRSVHAPEVPLRVAGAMAALGVSGDQTVELLVRLIETDRPAADVLSLPGQVEAGVSRGMTPTEAAGAAARAKPGRGRPPERPKKPRNSKP
jgi:hypothetical protein